MNEIIKVNEETMTVSGRDLYDALCIKERFSLWASRQKSYFGDEITTVCAPTKVANNGGVQIRELEDFIISVDNAKHICLMCKTEKGAECRQYLIDLEKAWNTPEQVMARALKIADQTIANLKVENRQLALDNAIKEQRINELQPKADYTDIILKSKGAITITQIAKDYGMSGKEMNKVLNNLGIQYKQSGQWLLYSKYQSNGYTESETVPITRKNGMPDYSINTKWTQKGRLFLYTILKENGILPMIER